MAGALRKGVHVNARFLHRLQNLLCVGHKGLALGGKRYRAAPALKQRHPQLFFQIGDRHAQAGLRNKQLVSGVAHAAGAHNGIKISDLLKSHTQSLAVIRKNQKSHI